MRVPPLLDIRLSAVGDRSQATLVTELRRSLDEELVRIRRTCVDAYSSVLLPGVVLADDATCERFFPERPGYAAARLTGQLGPCDSLWGKGKVSGDDVLADWIAAGSVVAVDGGLRSRLASCLPGLLPALGSRVVLLNLDALLRLERSVHPSGRQSRPRLTTLADLVLQREVLTWQTGTTTVRQPQLLMVGLLHASWLRHHPQRHRFAPAQRWFAGLARTLAPPEAPTVGDWLDRIHAPRFESDPWRAMVTRLAEAGINVYHHDHESPPGDGRQHMDPRLRDLLEDGEPQRPPEWSATDLLGQYVRAGSASGLPPGVHVFIDRVEEAAGAEGGPDLQTLAWHVLWHELGHWRLDSEGAEHPELLRLAPINQAEIFCEVSAFRAVEAGASRLIFPGLSGPAGSARPIMEWRQANPLLPYSAFPASLLPQSLVEDRVWVDATLTAIRLLGACERAWSVADGPDVFSPVVVRALTSLQRGDLGLNAQVRLLEDLAADKRERPRLLSAPVVYLWRRGT